MSEIRSRPGTREFREGFDRINWRESTFSEGQPSVTLCRVCERPGTTEDPILIGHVHHRCIVAVEREHKRLASGG